MVAHVWIKAKNSNCAVSILRWRKVEVMPSGQNTNTSTAQHTKDRVANADKLACCPARQGSSAWTEGAMSSVSNWCIRDWLAPDWGSSPWLGWLTRLRSAASDACKAVLYQVMEQAHVHKWLVRSIRIKTRESSGSGWGLHWVKFTISVHVCHFKNNRSCPIICPQK